MSKYDDIIDMPHYVSPVRTPMSMEGRSAQFAPFAALTGHDDAIAETARINSEKPALSADELLRLSRMLVYAVENGVEIAITYFEPDGRKKGGSYRQISGKVKKIDRIEGMIVLADNRSVPLGSVTAISGEGMPEED